MEVARRRPGRQVQRARRPKTFRKAPVVRQHPQRLRVAEDRHTRPRGQRLPGEQQARVDQFGDRVHPDHPGLPQQRGDGRVRQPCRPYRVPLRRGTDPLHHHQRLRRRRAPGQAGELARVADGLQVHQHDVGLRVVVPVLEDVVAGDVGAVPGGHESGHAGDPGDPSPAPVQPGQQRDADGSGLREQAYAAGARHLGGQRGVQTDAGCGVDDAEGVRADDPHAVRARVPHEGPLPLAPFGPALRIPGGEDDEALDPVLAALGDHRGHLLRRYGDDGEVHRPLDVPHRPVRRDAVDLLEVLGEGPVHGVQAAGVAGGPEVAEDAAPHPAGRAADADDRDGAGRQQPPYRASLGALLAGALHGEGAVGGFEVELQADHAVLEAALLGVPGVREHLDHPGVGGQHLGGEAADAALARDGRDVLQKGGGDPAALMGVLHQEGDFGLVGGRGGGQAVGADAVVAYGGDELAADGGREPHPVHKVVVREAVDVLGGQARVGREEAVVLRLVRDLLVEADQAVGVINGDGPDARGTPVAQHHVRLPVGGVLMPVAPVRRALHGPQSTARVRQRREAVCGGRKPDRGRGPATHRGGAKARSGHASRYGKLV